VIKAILYPTVLLYFLLSELMMPATLLAEDTAVIEEVIVTARKREEAIQEVPMSVSVMAGERIEQTGVLNVEYLYGDVPNLYFAQNNTLSSQSDSREIMIRGVAAIPLLEPSAGVFIDGIYQTGLRFDISFSTGPSRPRAGPPTAKGSISCTTTTAIHASPM